MQCSAPGPGSYQIDKKKNKKQKYIKIKKELLQPANAKTEIYAQPILGIQSDMSHIANVMTFKERKLYQYNKSNMFDRQTHRTSHRKFNDFSRIEHFKMVLAQGSTRIRCPSIKRVLIKRHKVMQGLELTVLIKQSCVLRQVLGLITLLMRQLSKRKYSMFFYEDSNNNFTQNLEAIMSLLFGFITYICFF